MKTWITYLLIGLFVLILVLIVGGWLLIRLLNYFPKEQMPAELHCPPQSPAIASVSAQKPLRILSWNIQFGASRKYHFFYDGGKAVVPARSDVEDTLKAIAKVIDTHQPDIILWQEIDRDSHRTYRIDQLQRLWRQPPYQCWAATPYHKSVYVPHPAHQHLQRVNMQLTVFSRYQIKQATRHALPQLHESFLRRAFNLKRAVLAVEIPIAGKSPLVIFNTHFSAFSFGDGTMPKQVAKYMQLIQEAEKAKMPWLAAGDLNLLPPGDSPQRLGEEAKYYPSDQDNPLKLMFDKWRSPITPAEYHKNPQPYNTYLPFGSAKADRWIDHLFVSNSVQITRYEVLHQYSDISDHLPILFEIHIKDQ